MTLKPVVLHITDLHFTTEPLRHSDDRELALQTLIDAISALPVEWHPSILCITGDIANRGVSADYELASKWLDQLLGRFAIPLAAVFTCPGNHDVDRAYATRLPRPYTAAEADQTLAPPINPVYGDSFKTYSQWCTSGLSQ